MDALECEFEPIDEYGGLFGEDQNRKKHGRYDGSNLNVKGIGVTCWPVVANIIPHFSLRELVADGITEDGIVARCFEYLNQKPKRARKLKYGALSPRFFIMNFEKNKISVSFTTTDRNNKLFWGRGSKLKAPRKMTKRGRPKKK